MAEEEQRSRAMSLIPYAPEHSRQVVLRHESTVVLFDPRSRQLSLRSASPPASHQADHCPTCRRPFRDASPERSEPTNLPPSHGYMNPEYFDMLQQSLGSSQRQLNSSGRHRHLQPYVETPPGAEFVASEPHTAGHGISEEAFSHNYFKTFFTVEKELGRGGKGVVLLVQHTIDGLPLGTFACKRVPVGNDHAWLEKVLIEVQTLQKLSHPNLVSYRHVWLENQQINNFGPKIPCAFILQQYCNFGDLHNYVLGQRSEVTPQQLKDRLRRRSKGQMEEPIGLSGPRNMQFDDIYTFFKDITSGLHHLHSHGFIHRDIKPSNCLLDTRDSRIRVLLSDFGEVQDANSIRNGTGATGTVSYCAPEVLQRNGSYAAFGNFSVKSDVFSLGMIVHFMCFGALPYTSADDINEDTEDVDQLREEIMAWPGYDDGQRRGRTDLPELLYKFLKRLLAIDPQERPTTDEILNRIITAQDLNDWTDSAPPTFRDDARNSRISSADSPMPHSRTPFQRKTSSGGHPAFSSSLSLAAPSKLSHTYNHTSPPASPRTDRGRSLSPGKHLSSNAIVRAHKASITDHNHNDTLSRPTSPLALPPAPQYYTLSTIAISVVLPFFKLFLFLLKYLILTKPCGSHSPRSSIAYPILTLAILDFVLPFAIIHPWLKVPKWTFLLLLMHLFIITWAKREGMLCERSPFPTMTT